MVYYLSIYIGFLSVVTSIYYFVSDKLKHVVLSISSLGIIAYVSWTASLFVLIFATFNYIIALYISKFRQDPGTRRKIFWTGIILDIAFLALFKYFDFLFSGVIALLSLFKSGISWQPAAIIIPLGVSYYTFQSLGYIIRVNRGSEKPEKDFLKLLTLLVFFPKFISGPVERSNHFFPQLNKPVVFNLNQVSEGLGLFIWGAFKKVVVAGGLYFSVHKIYSDITNFSGAQLVLVFFVQTIYIYMEFSGYTDMALGSAKILGINLIDNFNRPFLARNISDFWRRWHISLSSWCNDFIYSPYIVKYRKRENFAIVTGVFLTFFVVGIWHAANWTFVVLGILQGIAIVYEFYTKKIRIKFAARYPKTIVTIFSRIIVFVFVSLSMVFFFSSNISVAWYFLSHMFIANPQIATFNSFIPEISPFLFALACFVLIFIAEIYSENGRTIKNFFLQQPLWLKGIGYLVLVTIIYIFNNDYSSFEYMKF